MARAGESRKKARLPTQQLIILAICRFAEPVAQTSVYPYIPEMIASFNVPTDSIAKWAGLLAAVFSLSQCLTGISWGRASDKFGRKPIIMLGLTCTLIASVAFGFSQSLTWAIATRSMQGLSNGNVGIIRTVVAEMVPQKELQPRAFSLMPLVWTVGSIFGPALGGSLVKPAERFPEIFGRFKLFRDYPFVLPNLLISVFFVIGIVSGFLFLKESHEDKKGKRDVGLVVGSLMTRSCTGRQAQRKKNHWRTASLGSEADPFLPQGERDQPSEMSSPVTPVNRNSRLLTPSTEKPDQSWSSVFTPQSNVNLAVYTLLAMHSVAFDQLVPVFLHHPVQYPPKSPSADYHPPLKFSGGYGLTSSRIGFLFTIYGIYGMLVQFFVFPPCARKFGVLNCLKACAITFPVVYIIVPFTALLSTNNKRQSAMMALMMVKGFCAIFAFPCSTILLTNSATSMKILGTLNGVATSVSAVGRAAGPVLTGAMFSVGVDKNMGVLSWWVLAGVAMCGAIPVFWGLREMEGFSSGGSREEDEDSDASSDEGGEEDGLLSHQEEREGQDWIENNSDDDESKGLTSSTTADSRVSKRPAFQARPSSLPIPEAEGDCSTIQEDDSSVLPSNTRSLSQSLTPSSTLLSSKKNPRARSRSRRESTELLRIPSRSPIGMGREGVRPAGARRFSSDLGASRSGYGNE